MDELNELQETQSAGTKHDNIYSILDTLEDVRGQKKVLEVLKRAYPDVSRAFIMAVIAFDREIQQLSLEKEPVGVIVRGEEWISRIFEISERGLLVEPDVASQGRGAEPHLVSIAQVKQWIYE